MKHLFVNNIKLLDIFINSVRIKMQKWHNLIEGYGVMKIQWG